MNISLRSVRDPLRIWSQTLAYTPWWTEFYRNSIDKNTIKSVKGIRTLPERLRGKGGGKTESSRENKKGRERERWREEIKMERKKSYIFILLLEPNVI